jgi:hypothetical protein
VTESHQRTDISGDLQIERTLGHFNTS